MKSIKLVWLYSLAALLISGVANGQTTANTGADRAANPGVIETGKFHFYETKQIRGEENFEISRAANGELLLTAKTDLPSAEQESKPLVNVTLRTSADFTPQAFQTKGPTLLDLEESSSVMIEGPAAKVQDRGHDTTASVPKNFFTMSGYAPVAGERMLAR